MWQTGGALRASRIRSKPTKPRNRAAFAGVASQVQSASVLVYGKPFGLGRPSSA